MAASLLAGLLLLGTAGCSTRKIIYGLAPRLVLSWLDDKLDLTRVQKDALRPRIKELFAWHRASELGLYADRIDQLRDRLRKDLTEDDLRWMRSVGEELGARVGDRAVPVVADLLVSLTPAQLQRVAKMGAEDWAELAKKEALPVEKWVKEATDQDVKSMARWVGSVTPGQRALFEDYHRRTRADHFAAWHERIDGMDRFGALVRAPMDPGTRAATLAAEMRRMFDEKAQPATPEVAARRERRDRDGNALAIAVWSSTTPAQRRRLDGELVSWRDDFRELATTR